MAVPFLRHPAVQVLVSLADGTGQVGQAAQDPHGDLGVEDLAVCRPLGRPQPADFSEPVLDGSAQGISKGAGDGEDERTLAVVRVDNSLGNIVVKDFLKAPTGEDALPLDQSLLDIEVPKVRDSKTPSGPPSATAAAASASGATKNLMTMLTGA
ncbi:hypothetical protein ABZ612_33700 [Streptomyces avermitilis]|uniref:hypothetical protein n=1 Tax=Streptomyces avermitilis TaxID=33903 RepID=UPI0033C65A26